MRERKLLAAATVCGFLGASAALALFGRPHAQAADGPRAEAEAKLKGTLAELKDASAAFRLVAKLVRPSVVHLTRERVVTEEPDPFAEMFERFYRDRGQRRAFKERAYGTGFIVRADGICLTNNHVAGGGGKLTAKLADGREMTATVVGADEATDVAVVKLDLPAGTEVTPVAFADSDAVEVGDWALAFGNPFGLEQSVTAGIISAKSRSHVGIAAYEDFIQTDAAINPGNSGGPLVDISGRVIGINTAIASRSGGYQGIGFTIPINMARVCMDSILKSGHVVRGYLGVFLDPTEMDPQNRPQRAGALVTKVAPGGPADAAGIQPGDVVTAFDGRPVEDGARLRLLAAATAVGRTVPIRVVREGKELELKVTVAELPAQPRAPEVPAAPPEPRAGERPSVGITARKITPELRAQFDLPAELQGVVVTEVAAGSLAARAGVQPGNVIRKIDGRDVASMADLDAAVGAMDLSQGVELVLTDGARLWAVRLVAR